MIGLSSRLTDHTVCVIGLGYVGLTLAAVMADCGFRVYGIDVRENVVDGLRRGLPIFHEPGLVEHLHRAVDAGRFLAAQEIPEDCAASVYIITVGTPLDADGQVRLDMVTNATRSVARRLRDGDLVIMRSTVKLGTTRAVVQPILVASGRSFDLAFCPERTVEGFALSELRSLPQIVGADSIEANVRASQLFQLITPTVVRVSSVETAEMIKVVDNAYRDVTFAYANELARIADAAGISVTEVIRAGNLGYGRTNVPWPGPVGGPSMAKDPHLLAAAADELSVPATLTRAARRTNEEQPEQVADMLAGICAGLVGFAAVPLIALLGIAFKGRPASDDLRATMARPVLDALKRRFPAAQFHGYDPIVAASELAAFGLAPCGSLEAAFAGASLVVVCNNHGAFAAMPVDRLAERMARPGLIYDFWNNFTAGDIRLPAGVGYVGLGNRGQAVLPYDA